MEDLHAPVFDEKTDLFRNKTSFKVGLALVREDRKIYAAQCAWHVSCVDRYKNPVSMSVGNTKFYITGFSDVKKYEKLSFVTNQTHYF